MVLGDLLEGKVLVKVEKELSTTCAVAMPIVIETFDTNKHAGDALRGCMDDEGTEVKYGKVENADFRVAGTPLHTWKQQK